MYMCVYVYSTHHNFLIHSSVDGHLGCLFIFSVVNNATVNIEVRISFFFSLFLVWTDLVF